MGEMMAKRKKKKAPVEIVVPDRFVSQEKVRDKTDNTYEGVMISSREARRMNTHIKMLGTELDRSIKVTSTAMERFLDGDVYFDYKNKSADE